ncbi:hypothetical protein DFH09DRAFT_1070331 [Mycena vulgaris]|nr:hypothetical protein DFH09DRAFT_1070331 [Mycena vulgaris]
MAALRLLLAVFLVSTTALVNSPEGFALVRQILAALPTFEPHGYQQDGVCKNNLYRNSPRLHPWPLIEFKTFFIFSSSVRLNCCREPDFEVDVDVEAVLAHFFEGFDGVGSIFLSLAVD